MPGLQRKGQGPLKHSTSVHSTEWEGLARWGTLRPAPKTPGARPCAKATEGEPGTQVTPKLTEPLHHHRQKPPPIITSKPPDSPVDKEAHSREHPVAPQLITSHQPSSRHFVSRL